jgi:hypothetical protein
LAHLLANPAHSGLNLFRVVDSHRRSEPMESEEAKTAVQTVTITIMSTSAHEPQLNCGKCGGSLQRVGKCTDRCVACLLELAWNGEEIASADAERFDHYRIATHTNGTPVELGRGAMGITFKAFDTVLRNAVALKVIDARIAAHREARERFLREARAASAPERRLGLLLRDAQE